MYFKNEAWDADLEGETRVYVVKDSQNRIPLYFSLKCGLLFKKKNYDLLEEAERDFVDAVLKAKKDNNQELLEAYYEYGSSDFENVDYLINIANQRYTRKTDPLLHGIIDFTLQVGTCYSAIELQHFCKNENYIPEIKPELLQVPFGFGIFWEVIVPEIFKITDTVGCKYLYLFAADKTENSLIQKLVHYYKNALKFYECQDDGINIIEPDYDENCYGLVQEISKLRINQEAVWEQYSDIFSINKERRTAF